MSEQSLTTRDLAGRGPGDDRPEPDQPPGGTAAADAYAAAGTPSTAVAAATDDSRSHEPLLSGDQTERFTSRWHEIQASFVDEPRHAVEDADTLVADLMQRLATSLSNERERLERQWDGGEDVSTEDLRVALTRYRSFFERLLEA
jgi:hypothetical protein